jgi:hypothetical protein
MQTEELTMFSPTLLSKIHELTNNSSVETFVIVGAQAQNTLLMLVSISARFDSGLMFKELGSYATSDAAMQAAASVASALEIYEGVQIINVHLDT